MKQCAKLLYFLPLEQVKRKSFKYYLLNFLTRIDLFFHCILNICIQCEYFAKMKGAKKKKI